MNTIILKARFLEAVKAKDVANVYRFRDLLNVARVKDDVVYEWVKKATEQKVSDEELDELVQQGKRLYKERKIGTF
tara:strand:+ start:3498 stop:3725 length:228 start_codon:yes stop_codon:yes gene_type:complete